MDEYDNESNTTCGDQRYDDSTYYGLMCFRCVLSILSIFFILSMLSIMVLFKKYQFFTQRLILYLAISSLAYQIISAMDVTSVRASHGDQTALEYCRAVAFLSQVINWWPVIATTIIMVEVFVRVVFDKSTKRLEILYVFLIFFLSLLINWIPFVYSAYGPSGYFCWIVSPGCRSEDNSGVILQALLYFVPDYILSIIMFVLLVITAVVLRRSRHFYDGKYDPKAESLRKKMESEIKPMMYYPIIFIISANVTLFITIYTSSAKVADAITMIGYIVIGTILSTVFRLQGVFLTLVFVLDPETKKRLNPRDMKAAAYEFFKKQDDLEYPAKYNARSDSIVTSSRNSTVQLGK